jgi:hypothetical protein
MMYLLSCYNKSGDPAGLHSISMKVSDARVQVYSKTSTKVPSALKGKLLRDLLHSTSHRRVSHVFGVYM